MQRNAQHTFLGDASCNGDARWILPVAAFVSARFVKDVAAIARCTCNKRTSNKMFTKHLCWQVVNCRKSGGAGGTARSAAAEPILVRALLLRGEQRGCLALAARAWSLYYSASCLAHNAALMNVVCAGQGLKRRDPRREEVVMREVLPLASWDAEDDIAAVMAAVAAAAMLTAGSDIDAAGLMDADIHCTLPGQGVRSVTLATAEEAADGKTPSRVYGVQRGPAVAAWRATAKEVVGPGQLDGAAPAAVIRTAPSKLSTMVRFSCSQTLH